MTGSKESVVAKLPNLRNLDSLREAFYVEGVLDIEIRDMGGNLVLLTFPSVPADLKSILEGGDQSWLFNWFCEVNQWTPSLIP